MRLSSWLMAIARADLSVRELDAFGRGSAEAYELVEGLPRGSARVSAWNAYVFQTYADKLVETTEASRHLTDETAQLIKELYALVPQELQQAPTPPERPPASQPALPHCHTPIRTREQLIAMRRTLDILKTFVAHDLETASIDPATVTSLRERLSVINRQFDVEGLWIPRPPPELRGKIGQLLANGLQAVYSLGQLLAQHDPSTNPSPANESS